MELTEYDQRTYGPLIALAAVFPDDLRARLAAAHEQVGWSCAAHSEGQLCCLDIIEAD